MVVAIMDAWPVFSFLVGWSRVSLVLLSKQELELVAYR